MGEAQAEQESDAKNSTSIKERQRILKYVFASCLSFVSWQELAAKDYDEKQWLSCTHRAQEMVRYIHGKGMPDDALAIMYQLREAYDATQSTNRV